MRLCEVVRTSEAVAASPGRLAKVEALSVLLSRAAPSEAPAVVAYLSGDLPQRQIGVGYSILAEALRQDGAPEHEGVARAAQRRDRDAHDAVASAAPLSVLETDSVLTEVSAVSGPGSQARRRDLLAGLFARATAAEREFLARLIAGELRQGAQEGVMVEAVARAAGVPAGQVRRAHLLGGSLPAVAAAALAAGREPGGPPDADAAIGALRSFGLRVGRPLRPMLASAAASVEAALGRVSPAVLEWKIDGIRVQVHRDGSEVAVFTRTLDDITGRVPEITEHVLALDLRSAVLDGEIVALGHDGRPLPFQVTAGRVGTQAGAARQRRLVPLTPFFFDLLHLDGQDLVDEPASSRFARMTDVLPGRLVIPRLATGDLPAARAFFADAVAQGHEGVVVKSPSAPYAAGRRGREWIKVKPRHTLDLIVLAAEWGHGRRRGWLSNLHLGARDPATGGLVMLGKTFKGLTDEMLGWQTQRLLALADPPAGPDAGVPRDGPPAPHGAVRVRPELVVEVAFDGVQASTRYPGGLALRFARVLRYRADKPASEADTIDTLRALWPGAPAPPSAGDRPASGPGQAGGARLP